MDLHTLVEALEAARLADSDDVGPWIAAAARDAYAAKNGNGAA